MGDYITTSIEVRKANGWVENKKAVFTNMPSWPGHTDAKFTSKGFFWQSCTMYSLFAGVRVREHGIVPLAPNRGFPDDACDESLIQLLGGWGNDKHWMDDSPDPETVAEKVASRNDSEIFGLSWVGADELMAVDYGVPVTDMNPPFETTTLRDALGSLYWNHLQQLIKLGDPDKVRVLFCFSQ
ncbi:MULTISPECIES: hypothetical protein [Pseudomonas]|uniref:hypothetical protein n=1 Tax=Pseudomonas TaxID=286 RepID=UPI000F027AA3|nr:MULTISPECIES: hypothetical protein [Pseudomonas]MBD8681710.1 hypothetical protein [Pseudomonas sp. CFBP 13719]